LSNYTLSPGANETWSSQTIGNVSNCLADHSQIRRAAIGECKIFRARATRQNSAEQLGRGGGGRAGAQNFILKACEMPCYNEVSHPEETVGRSIKVRQE